MAFAGAPLDLGKIGLEPTAAGALLVGVRSEQQRYLALLGDMGGDLARQSPELAVVTAVQARLTRRFFDAQRAILERRASVDVEIARLEADTRAAALALIDAARAEATAAGVAVDVFLPPAPDATPAELDAPYLVDLDRAGRALASMHMAAVSAADAMAAQVEDALSGSVPVGAAADAQLRALLDEWWRAETAECKALIDDAHARSAVRLHDAQLRADDIVRAAAMPAALPVAVLPSSLAAQLDRSDGIALDDLLASLADSLEEAVIPSASYPDDRHPVISMVEPAVLARDPFDHFWNRAVTAAPVSAVHRDWWWIPTQVIVPIVAVTSLLALAMAWIG